MKPGEIKVWGHITSHVHTNTDGSTIVIRAMGAVVDQTVKGFFAHKKGKRRQVTEEGFLRLRPS